MSANNTADKIINSEIYCKLEGELGHYVKDASDYEEFVNFKDNETMPIHRWYDFKEGYAARLVEMMLSEFNVKLNSIVLDPFAGSGTTLLSSQLKGMRAIGIDINPFFTFVQQVKLDWFKFNLENVKNEIDNLSNIDNQESPTLIPPELSSFAGKRKPAFYSNTKRATCIQRSDIWN